MANSVLQGRAKRRSIYTGETFQQARNALLKVGKHDPAIPDAGVDQAALEARVLVQLGKHEYVMWNHDDPPLGIDSLTPERDGLILCIRHEFLPDFIGAVMPSLEDFDNENVFGVAGMRVRRYKGHVILYRLGAGGAIRLPVSGSKWDKAAQVIMAENGITSAPWLTHPTDWHPAELKIREAELFGIGGRWYRNSGFASQVLRRLHALHIKPYPGFVDLWLNPRGPGYSIELEWSHGPSHGIVIERLLDGNYGLNAHLDPFDRDKLQTFPPETVYDVEITSNDSPRNELHLRRNNGEEFLFDPAEDRDNRSLREARIQLCARYGY